MTHYRYTGTQEQAFPTLRNHATGAVLVCQPGEVVELADDPNHLQLELVGDIVDVVALEPVAAASFEMFGSGEGTVGEPEPVASFEMFGSGEGTVGEPEPEPTPRRKKS